METSVEQPNQDGDSIITLGEVLQAEEEMIEDANAVLGAGDDKNCTYTEGYMKRQALYACLTCIPEAKTDPSKQAGVCLACCYHCHDGHELVELYTKRAFRCDCGNSKFPNMTCSLYKDKDEVNELNKYNQNFSGLYCVCKRPYPDPEDTVPDEMIQCIICEDWFHTRHLDCALPSMNSYVEMTCKDCIKKHDFLLHYEHLCVTAVTKTSEQAEVKVDGEIEAEVQNGPKSVEINGEGKEVPENQMDSEDIPADVDGALEEEKSEEKVDENGEDVTEKVDSSNKKEEATEDNNENNKEVVNENEKVDGQNTVDEDVSNNVENTEEVKVEESKENKETEKSGEETEGIKDTEKAEEESKENDTGNTEKLENENAENETKNEDQNKPEEETKDTPQDVQNSSESEATNIVTNGCLNACRKPKNKSDNISAKFWANNNWRQQLCTCNDCITMYKEQEVIFLIDPCDTVQYYEAKGKAKSLESAKKAEEESTKFLNSLDRVPLMETLAAFNDLKQNLIDYLKKFAENKKVVREEDIREFFSDYESRKRQKVDIPHTCR